MSGGCSGSATETTSFVYDGDGKRVQATASGTTTSFIGNYYELTGAQVTKYYFAGTQRIAMRKYTIPQPMTLEYLLGDDLGSTSITTDSNGTKVSEVRYKPWGEIRFSWTAGTVTTPAYKLISYTFTGQYSYMDDPTTTGTTEGFGLIFYNARFYSPYINHFLSPDTIVPGHANPQSWNRYSYTLNNPLRYTDPTGHMVAGDTNEGCRDLHQCKKDFLTRRAWDLAKSLNNKKDRNDLDAMTDIIDLGATLFKTNDELIPVLSGIFLGTEESNPLTVLHAAQTNPCAAVGKAVTDCAANKDRGSFGDAGFHEDFQDGFSQPFHFWAYLATAANTQGTGPASYIPGAATSLAGNIEHEIIVPDGAGATWQDYALARAGANIGTLVNMGVVPPDELGNTITSYVGASGPGAFYVNPLKFLLPLQGNR